MRVMLRFWFPTESGNEGLRNGKVAKVFQMIAEELHPEAAYFFPDHGDRAGLFVFNMETGSQVAEIAERFFQGLNAKIEMTPVMTADDLQKAMGTIQEFMSRYS